MKTIHRKALHQITALWAASAVAAGAWASGLTEEGYILGAVDWHSEVASVPSPDWPVDRAGISAEASGARRSVPVGTRTTKQRRDRSKDQARQRSGRAISGLGA